MTIPAYLRYDLDDALRIARLQAFWELPAMVRQFARSGVGALPAGLQLSRALLRNQGWPARPASSRVSAASASRGKRHLAALLDDACAGDEVAVKRRLGDAARAHPGRRRPASGPPTWSRCCTGPAGTAWSAPGSVVVARVRRARRPRGVLFAEVEHAVAISGRCHRRRVSACCADDAVDVTR